MPQSSIASAVGRVRAAARKPLGEAQLERLLSAASYDEALRLLGEMGWPDLQGLSVEQLSVQMIEQACSRLREITPDLMLTDTFLLRHDAQNLKSLFKARILGVKADGLSNCGTISLDTLHHAVTEHIYRNLPPAFESVMKTLEQNISISVNPMEIDVRIDQALYGMIEQKLKSCKSHPSKDYFAGKADLQNAIAYLRLNAMQTSSIKLEDILLPGGTIKKKSWMEIAAKPEKLVSSFRNYGKTIQLRLMKAQQDGREVPALEKAADDYLLDLFRPMRNDPFSIEVLIGWLLAHEREASAVRLIMAGKLNDFPQELIRERLRDAYGR